MLTFIIIIVITNNYDCEYYCCHFLTAMEGGVGVP